MSRTKEIADFTKRVEEGRYIVLFAPRQTGKTTFFQRALDTLAVEKSEYLPIPLNFDVYKNTSVANFYENLCEDIREEIENAFQQRGVSDF